MPENRIRRVLMTGDTVGGVWTFTIELARGLAAQGIETLLATFGGHPSRAQMREAAAIPSLGLLGSTYKLEWMANPWKDVEESGHWLLELEKEFSPDVIHLNSFGHGGLPWRVPAILTAHSCVLSWWAAVKREKVPDTWDRYRIQTTWSLMAAKLVTAPSATMGAALQQHYGIDPGHCRVIPNGVQRSRFHSAEKVPLILSAGRVWDEAKNMKILSRIAPALPWPVCVAGDAHGASIEGCHMLGRLSACELAEWYARSAIYVLPARYEPFGLSAVEAALSGCALVLGDIPSLREVWGSAGMFAYPDDVEGLRDALDRLIRNPELRETMARRAFERALEFDAAKMCNAYLDAYQYVLARRAASCAS